MLVETTNFSFATYLENLFALDILCMSFFIFYFGTSKEAGLYSLKWHFGLFRKGKLLLLLIPKTERPGSGTTLSMIE